MSRRSSSGDKQTLGCVVYFLIIVFCMPFVGLYLLTRPSADAKICGTGLLVLGIILWIWFACM